MSYPETYDDLTVNRNIGDPGPAPDNNAQGQAILALEHRVGLANPTDVRSIEYRLGQLETTPSAASLDFFGFDTSTDGWLVSGSGTVIRDTSAFHTGVASLKLTNGSSGQTAATHTFTATAGVRYLLRVWVKGAAGKFVNAKLSDGVTALTSVPVKLSSTEWREIVVTMIPASTNLVLWVEGVDLAAADVMWIDDVSVSTVTTPVMTVKGRSIFKNGAPKRWRGMNHSNVPIGYDYNRAWWQEPKQIRYDIQDIAAGGWDAIKLYADAYDEQGYNAMFDECLRNGIDVFMLYYAPHNTDYSVATGGANRTAAITGYQAMVNHTKTHPAVVAYGFGNEVNYELGGTTEADWFSLVNAAAAAAKAIDPTRITFTSNGDIGSLEHYDSVVTNLDVWGANVYRGTGFAGLDVTAQNFTQKPLIVTEFGFDRYNHNLPTPGEDEAGQAIRELSLTRELDGMSSVAARFHFEWADEWWKESTPNDVHNNAGANVNYNDDRDQTYDEEWFGINEALPTGSAQSRVHKRAYYDIQAYQLATPVNSRNLSVETVAQALGSPGGFTMRDTNYVAYQVQVSTRGVFTITPQFVLPPEDLTHPIFQVNDTAVHLTVGKVDTWTDISNSRRNAIQYNPANQPAFITGALNGHGILRFAGSGQFMDLGNLIVGGNLSIFIVAANKRTGDLTNHIDTLISNVPSGGVVAGVALDTFNYYGNPSQRQFTGDFSGGSNKQLWVNGSQASMDLTVDTFYVFSAQYTGVQAHNFMQIGLYTDGVLNGCNDIAEIIIYQGLLGTSARQAVENSLKTKYGIT
jgi:hypothetical protein